MKKMLISCFSWSNGNTRKIADKLRKSTGADLISIETVAPYTGSYDDVVAQGQREVSSGYRPELKKSAKDPADYDVVAIGTPTWWYTMAPAVSSYMYGHDWKGKTVIPFMTNGGWPGHVIKDMEAAAVGAECIEAMEIRFDSNGGDRQETPEKEVEEWVRKVCEFLKT